MFDFLKGKKKPTDGKGDAKKPETQMVSDQEEECEWVT